MKIKKLSDFNETVFIIFQNIDKRYLETMIGRLCMRMYQTVKIKLYFATALTDQVVFLAPF